MTQSRTELLSMLKDEEKSLINMSRRVINKFEPKSFLTATETSVKLNKNFKNEMSIMSQYSDSNTNQDEIGNYKKVTFGATLSDCEKCQSLS